MTVISVTPKYGSLVGTGHLAGVREYTKVFVVETDDVADGVMTVGNALGVPHKGDFYFWHGETDAGSLCWEVTPVRDTENELWWEVTCEFSSDMRGGEGGPLGQDPRYDTTNPLQNPPVVTWDHWEEEAEITFDRFGEAILTPVGKPYSPPLIRRVKHSRVVIVRNELFYPTVVDQTMRGVLNSDWFYGWAPRQAMFEDVSATSQFAQNLFFWQVRYEIRFKKPDFDRDVLRMDTVVLKQQTVEPFLFLPAIPEADGIPHTNPVMLNPNGTEMSQADIAAARLLPPRAPGSLFDKIEVDDQLPFSALNL